MFSFKKLSKASWGFFKKKNNSEESLMLGKWNLKGAGERSQMHFKVGKSIDCSEHKDLDPFLV